MATRFRSLFIRGTSVSLKSPNILQNNIYLEKIHFIGNNLFMILENTLHILKKYCHQY